jgi:hypothetical protein
VQSDFPPGTPPNFTTKLGVGVGMRRKPVEGIVDFLNFSRDHLEPLSVIEKFSRQQWKYVLQWLDDAGLAFYFLQKLKDTHASDAVPPFVLSHLRQNFASNESRMKAMSRRFESINNSFTDAGVHYMVLKGFSLVPQFCPFAPLRHQADLDYLVEEQSLSAACRVLSNAGYTPQRSRSGEELIYVSRGGGPSRGDRQYSPQSPHAVELHTDIWDSRMHRVVPIPSLFSVAQAATHHWNGIMFPAQKDEDAFLLQVLHACHHFFTQWIRMSCLYEIGYFLHQRASDSELWSGIEQRAGDSAVLREFVVIVTGLAARLFAAPVPDLVQSWGTKIRPGPRIWTEHYARDWALGGLPVYDFSLFPRAKLVLFLHQQYKSMSWVQESPNQSESPSGLSRIVSSVKKDPSLVVNRVWWKRQHLFRRTIFYVLAGLRYVCEIPRWRWRNRTYLQRTTAPWTSDSLSAKKAS